jgi:hypothetical protein
MFKPCVVRAGKDKIGKSKLVYPVQSLHFRPLQDVEKIAFEPHAAVNAIMNDLEARHRVKIIADLFIIIVTEHLATKLEQFIESAENLQIAERST